MPDIVSLPKVAVERCNKWWYVLITRLRRCRVTMQFTYKHTHAVWAKHANSSLNHDHFRNTQHDLQRLYVLDNALLTCLDFEKCHTIGFILKINKEY